MSLLVVSPHPDDETLGCGGTILKYKKNGHQVYWLNITNMKEEYGYSKERIQQRQKELDLVKKQYEIDVFYDLALEPAGLDKYSSSQLIKAINVIMKELQPETVILPYRYDIHSDHKIVLDAVYSCTKIFRYPSIKKILCMEILSETDFAQPDNGFVPNYFIDITEYLEHKIDVMKIYESEIGDHPFPRSRESITALSILRGASSGVAYAEAFKLIKCIE